MVLSTLGAARQDAAYSIRPSWFAEAGEHAPGDHVPTGRLLRDQGAMFAFFLHIPSHPPFFSFPFSNATLSVMFVLTAFSVHLPRRPIITQPEPADEQDKACLILLRHIPFDMGAMGPQRMGRRRASSTLHLANSAGERLSGPTVYQG